MAETVEVFKANAVAKLQLEARNGTNSKPMRK